MPTLQTAALRRGGQVPSFAVIVQPPPLICTVCSTQSTGFAILVSVVGLLLIDGFAVQITAVRLHRHDDFQRKTAVTV